MQPSDQPVDPFEELPDPGRASSLDDLVEQLRLLKVWAGDPSYEWITGRVNAAWRAAGRPAAELAGKATVVRCFRPGRRRLNPDLVVSVVAALHPDVGYVAHWQQALRVIGGETQAAAQVRVQDTLPPDLAGFTGRATELDRLRQVLDRGGTNGAPVVISAIEGMAGVGKTQLAIHAGHHLVRQERVDRVLFVNLRGFHPDPAQPPADPAAVLDGFLRLLGVPGQHIPHDLTARAALYRDRLAGTRTLIVLDNAATTDQVQPLLPETDSCLVLVTSRRDLTDLKPAAHLSVDVFTAAEAVQFLTRVALGVPVGDDAEAAARIAARCGYLPLALGLVAGHIRAKSGWTLTDHADRLDEHHHHGRIDTGIQAALDLSYQRLSADEQRLLRLGALHPGQDFDAYAAAALADTDLRTAQAHLHDLYRNHLLQQVSPGRYTFHDLIRAYATSRATDDDPLSQCRAALTRLFDYYLAAAGTAMNSWYPGEAHRRPRFPPTRAPIPVLADPDTALAWLDIERPTLVAVAAHTAQEGWPTHTTRLSTTLYRYLDGGHHTDALVVHSHANNAAQQTGDPTAQARALNHLGTTYGRLSRYGDAADHLHRALDQFRQADDPVGRASALSNLGAVEARLGRYEEAAGHHEQALALDRQCSNRVGEARSLNNLGVVEARLGRYKEAAGHHEQALALARQSGDRGGEADALNNLGEVEAQLDRNGQAAMHLHQALELFRQLGHYSGEAGTLDSLGTLHTRLGRAQQATEYYRHALALFHDTGDRYGEAYVLNGLGEAAYAAGRPADAFSPHIDALTLAVDIGARNQQARAHTGLGHAHHALGDPAVAHHHYQQALTLYTNLGQPEAEHIRAQIAALDDTQADSR